MYVTHTLTHLFINTFITHLNFHFFFYTFLIQILTSKGRLRFESGPFLIQYMYLVQVKLLNTHHRFATRYYGTGLLFVVIVILFFL
jgi:hypothetical protein